MGRSERGGDVPPGAVIFGGSAWPIGWQVGFVARRYEDVIPVVCGFSEVDRSAPVRGSSLERMLLEHLPPLETPFTRRLVIGTGGDWTAIFDNSIGGGDPFMWVSHLQRKFDCMAVVAGHIPRDQHAYPATQLHLFSPEGEPPVHYLRTIDAGIFDSGRWSFELWGTEQPFEDPGRYDARLKRERFTRAMLVAYLQALGIEADDPAWFREALLIQEKGDYRRRTVSLQQARDGA